MEKDVVLKVEGVYKKFSKSLKRSMLYGSTDIAKSMLGINYSSNKLRKGEFWSLENINFELKKGETIGLVGANGSGKSTLLRLINGIFPPDAGKISVRGRIGALIAVGAGFHPHMTGRENIFLNGIILGMTRDEVTEKFQDIIDFAEIGEFIDAPVSTYSSGMYVRLGFAIAIHSIPDIVLIDEVLAVGDSKFQRKCLDKIKELRENSNTSFILVSHNMQNIEAMCSKVVLMHKGKQIMVDTPANIIPVYELMLQNKEYNHEIAAEPLDEDSTDLKLVHKYPDFGTNEINVKSVRILDDKDNAIKELETSDTMDIEIELDSELSDDNVWIWTSFHYINDYTIEDKNYVSLGSRNKVQIKKGSSKLRMKFDRVQLTTGEYKIGIFFFDETFTNPYSQGHYGYFTVKNSMPTMLTAGKGTPLCWTYPEVKLSNN